MTITSSTRHFPLAARVLLPLAIAVSSLPLAGPAQAVPDAGSPTASTSAPTRPGIVPASAGATEAAADVARLRANLTRLHGGDHRATIWFDDAFGITVQRGGFAGRIPEYG
jgi:hypothetical protein